MKREQVRDKFKTDLQDAIFDFDASENSTTTWIQDQLSYDLPVILT
jgi:hypothetical protein